MAKENKENTTTYHHGNLRAALIEAGLEILSQEGENALGLRKVARAVGVSHAAPYKHFANKEALIAAIAGEGYQKLEKRMKDALAQFPTDSGLQLLELGCAYVNFALKNPNHLRVMFTDFSDDCKLETGETFILLVNAIKKGQDVDYVVDGDAMQIALSLWATVHGLSILIIENRIPQVTIGATSAEEVVRACIKTSLNGVLKK